MHGSAGQHTLRWRPHCLSYSPLPLFLVLFAWLVGVRTGCLSSRGGTTRTRGCFSLGLVLAFLILGFLLILLFFLVLRLRLFFLLRFLLHLLFLGVITILVGRSSGFLSFP